MSPRRAKPRPRYTLVLRPELGTDGVRALRALLKSALRRFGLRCLSVREDAGGVRK